MISLAKLQILLLAFVAIVGVSASGQTFTNPVRVATPVDPDSIASGDLNGDGQVDLIWLGVTSTNTVGHIELAQAGGSYLAGQTFTIPGVPASVPMCVTADVNRDGKIDVICATPYQASYSVTILVFPGNGDGTLGTPIATQIGSQYGQAIILASVGDLNGDGNPDFILEQYDYTPALVLLSDGRGGFLPTKTVENSYNTSLPLAADINGDGIPDILWPQGAGVALGKGDGSFANVVMPYPPATDPAPIDCAFHDMDGDGKLDAVCVYLLDNISGTVLDILHGKGDGTFNTTPIFHKTFGSTNILRSGTGDILTMDAVLDLNGDGIPDILAEVGDGLTVMLGQSGLTFSEPKHYALAYSGYEFSSRAAEQIQHADLNGDGLLDVLAAGPNGIYLLFGHPDGTFGSAVATKVSEVSGYIGIADFNGDGKPDLVSSGAPQTSVSFGNGDGTFASPALVQGSPFAAGSRIYTADFNGDGKADLLSSDSSSAYYLMFGKGDGTFDPAVATGLPPAPGVLSFTDDTAYYGLTVDLNADGKADFFTINTNVQSSTYSLVSSLSNGDGTFHTVNTSYPAPVVPASPYYYTPVAPVLGDFAHRGQSDAAYFVDESIYVVRGHGDGSFDTTPTVLATPTVAGVQADEYQAMQVADFDGDGNLDLAFLSWFQPPPYFYQGGPSCVFIYYGKGDGTFGPPTQAGCFTHAYTNFRTADVDGDGRPDLTLETASALNVDVIGVVRSLAGRTFGPEVNYTAGSLSGDLFVADLNLDSKPDLVFGNQRYEAGYSANSVTVLLNTSTAIATGTLTSMPNPSYVGQPFTITATLTPPTTGIVYAGNITFYVDGVSVGAAPVSGNIATIAGPVTLSAGTHQLSATWPGDTNDPPLTLSATHTVVELPLQILLTCSPNPSGIGQSVTLSTQFTATPPAGLAASSAPYTGTLSFYDGSILLDQQQVATAGYGFSLPTLAGGTHSILASYAVDSVYADATASCTQVVNKLPTTSQLSLNPVPYAGMAFQLITQVSPASATTAVPTGTVTFIIDGTLIGTGSVNPSTGVATFNDTGVSGGNHLLTCTYSGDSTFAGSSCPPNSLGVAPALGVLTLTSASNPAPAGAPITFTANLSGNSKPASGDTISFTISASGVVQARGSGTTDANGNAVFRSPGILLGTYSVIAFFAGTPDLQNVSSPTLMQVVVINATNTTLNASPNPGYPGETISLTAAVTAAGTPTLAAPIPNGVVTFFDGGTVLGTATLNASGVATFTTTSLAVGTHSLTASYPASTIFLGSTSAPFIETILDSSFTIALSPNTMTMAPGKSGTVAINLASVGMFAGPLTLTYGTMPMYATASIGPSTVTLAVAGTASSTLTLNTLSIASNAVPTRPGSPMRPFVFTATFLLLLPLFSRRKRLARILGVIVTAIAFQTLTGCTNSWYTAHSVAPGTYMIPVTATDINHNSQTANLTVIVTP